MKKIKTKKLILLIILNIFLCFIVGGQKNEYAINLIEEHDIMMQSEKEYYVFFYKDNCPYCDDVYNVLNEYLNNPKELKLYVCKIKENSLIEGKAENSDGQGPDGKYYVDYVISYDRLRIAGVPSLIKVRFNGAIDECFYVTSGKKNIIEYFEKLNSLE